MLKIFKMLKQIVSQLEQICLKLGFKNDYTLAVSNFTRQFVSQKWADRAKARSPKVLKLVLRILRRPWSQERRS